jgi:hypothetical protein
MVKNISDIIPPERRRSIRNIPISEIRKKPGRSKVDDMKRPSIKERLEDEMLPIPPPPRHIYVSRSRRFSRRRVTLAGLAGVLILAFAVLSIFDGATLAYVPKSAPLSFNNDIRKAQKTGEGSLLYSVVKLSGEKGINVEASGEEEVRRKASGTIIVYNTSAELQRLVENTRFETPAGKIYRIDKPIAVPAKGSVEAAVYADQTGPDYNTGLTDFTVPGLKGTSKYSSVYARSKTPMAGGFIGTEKVVNSQTLSKAKKDLQTALNGELLARAEAEVPADFILFSGLSVVSFEDLPQSPSTGKSVTINIKGHLYGIMFKRSDLSKALGAKAGNFSAEDKVEVRTLDSLQVSFAGAPPADLLSANEISFKVAGGATLIWQTDELALRSDLAGKDKSEIPNILKNYPAVVSASATVRPFWKSAMPPEPEKISIKELPVK